MPGMVSGISHAGFSAGLSTLSMGSVLQHPENLYLPFFPGVTFRFLVCFTAARGLAPDAMRETAQALSVACGSAIPCGKTTMQKCRCFCILYWY